MTNTTFTMITTVSLLAVTFVAGCATNESHIAMSGTVLPGAMGESAVQIRRFEKYYSNACEVPFLKEAHPDDALVVAPVGLRLTYDPAQRQTEPPQVPGYFELDLVVSGPNQHAAEPEDEQVFWDTGTLYSGYIWMGEALTEIRGPNGQPVHMADSIQDRYDEVGKGIPRISPPLPKTYIEHVLERTPDRYCLIVPVTVPLARPMPEPAFERYRIQLIDEMIHKAVSGISKEKASRLVIDDAWHTFELKKVDLLFGDEKPPGNNAIEEPEVGGRIEDLHNS